MNQRVFQRWIHELTQFKVVGMEEIVPTQLISIFRMKIISPKVFFTHFLHLKFEFKRWFNPFRNPKICKIIVVCSFLSCATNLKYNIFSLEWSDSCRFTYLHHWHTSKQGRVLYIWFIHHTISWKTPTLGFMWMLFTFNHNQHLMFAKQ